MMRVTQHEGSHSGMMAISMQLSGRVRVLTMRILGRCVHRVSIVSRASSYGSVEMGPLQQTIHTTREIQQLIDPKYGHSELAICSGSLFSLGPISYLLVMSAGILGKRSISSVAGPISGGHAMSERVSLLADSDVVSRAVLLHHFTNIITMGRVRVV